MMEEVIGLVVKVILGLMKQLIQLKLMEELKILGEEVGVIVNFQIIILDYIVLFLILIQVI